jgi:ERF superfamily
MAPIDPEFVEARVREIETFERRASAVTRRTPKNTIFQPNGAASMLTNSTETIAPPPPAATRRVPTKITINGEATAAPTPLSIVQAALASGNVEMYREAVALARDMDAIVSRKAFDNAMAAARAQIPVIRKNRRVGFDSRKPGASRTDYAHEDMAEIARTIDPILSAHGLSYRFRVSSEVNEPVKVTCIISHRDGHSEETSLRGARDDSGNKNSLQQIGSTVTYLQRYTLKAALGLSAAEDDDGRGAEAKSAEAPKAPGTISQAQADEIRTLLDSRRVSHRAFLQFIRLPRIEDIGAEHFGRVITKIKSFGGQS